MAPERELKRKQPPTKAQDRDPKVSSKRLKTIEARTIRTQPSLQALNERKELDVANFVKSHELEIRTLEQSITSAKSALAQRAFQQVPRHLRRRTASHNVKKVPKRLRSRAIKEMKEHNTQLVPPRGKALTGKQRLRAAIARDSNVVTIEKDSEPDVAMAAHPVVKKFKKRQLSKLWLPTHLYHAKRAHFTTPSNPLWNFAIPLTPTEKSYRQTHRACALRGCVAWDMSYISSVQISGGAESLLKFLRCLSVPEAQLTGHASCQWIGGTRSWTGWLHEENPQKTPIAPVTIIWSPVQSSTDARNAILRSHPSAFSQLWPELVRLAKMGRSAVAVRDMRFELGSIEINGPSAVEAVVRVIHPEADSASLTFKHWPALASVTNINTFPKDFVVGFSSIDPRLSQNPSTLKTSSQADIDEVVEYLSNWPPEAEQKQFLLLNEETRRNACQSLLSQSAINKRRSKEPPGVQLPESGEGHSFPGILYTSQSKLGRESVQSLTLLLPWSHVLPIWQTLMRVPLFSGGQPRLGCLREQRQLYFENGAPWFPADFPGTVAGWKWELKEREQRKSEWEKRPKAKRIQWEALRLSPEQKGELGRGWACDWEYLCNVNEANESAEAPDTIKDDTTQEAEQPPCNLQQGLSSSTFRSSGPPTQNALATISLSFINRGHASTCARIYRLPTDDTALRSAWEAFLQAKPANDRDDPKKPTPLTAAEKDYPAVPARSDLVGFITTGNYHLGKGQATAVGNVLIARMPEFGATRSGNTKPHGVCIIRDAGTTVGRIARWKVCS